MTDEQQFEITRNGTVMVFRVLEMDCPGDVWVITAEYVREYPAIRLDDDAGDKS